MKTALVTGACINTGVDIVNKFLSEGYRVVFTGRDEKRVKEAEKIYKEKFPDADVTGYVINSLKEDFSVDERSVSDMFLFLDKKEIFVDTLILNGADQGLGIKIFENSLCREWNRKTAMKSDFRT